MVYVPKFRLPDFNDLIAHCSENGSSYALVEKGDLLIKRGNPWDYKKGMEVFYEAQKMGNELACYKIAEQLLKKPHQEIDVDLVIYWLKKGEQAGCKRCLEKLARAYLFGDPILTGKKLSEAKKYLKGSTNELVKLSFLVLWEGEEVFDPASELGSYLERACYLKKPGASYMRAKYYSGDFADHREISYEKALTYYLQGVAEGRADALIEITYKGIFTEEFSQYREAIKDGLLLQAMSGSLLAKALLERFILLTTVGSDQKSHESYEITQLNSKYQWALSFLDLIQNLNSNEIERAKRQLFSLLEEFSEKDKFDLSWVLIYTGHKAPEILQDLLLHDERKWEVVVPESESYQLNYKYFDRLGDIAPHHKGIQSSKLFLLYKLTLLMEPYSMLELGRVLLTGELGYKDELTGLALLKSSASMKCIPAIFVLAVHVFHSRYEINRRKNFFDIIAYGKNELGIEELDYGTLANILSRADFEDFWRTFRRAGGHGFSGGDHSVQFIGRGGNIVKSSQKKEGKLLLFPDKLTHRSDSTQGK